MNNTTKLVLALLVSSLVFGCNMTGANQDKNVQLIEKYVQAVENLDYETMASCLDENYIGIGPSIGDSIRKPAALKNWEDNVENLYESIKYLRSRNIAVHISDGDNQGEWVSNWGEVDIKYKDNRGEVTIMANSIYQISNGKIVKSYTFYNEADAMEQLGYVFINLNDL